MALTISSCNTFHMLPELPCFHNYYLNPKIYTKLLSELLYSCTPELLKRITPKKPLDLSGEPFLRHSLLPTELFSYLCIG